MSNATMLATVSALALLAATATTGLAQSPGAGSAQEQQKISPGTTEGNRGEDGTQQKGAIGKADSDARSGQRGEASPKASPQAQEKASPKSRVQNDEAAPRPSERAQEKAAPNSAVQGRKSGDDDSRGKRVEGEKKKNTSKQSDNGSKDNEQSASDGASDAKRGDRNRGGTAEHERAHDGKQSDKGAAKDRDRTADDVNAKDRDGRGRRDGPDRADGSTGKADRVQLSDQKRTSIQERISKSGRANHVTKVDFDIHVGSQVPRTASLHVLPADVVEIVPEYRGYRYVYVRDEIVIVHPTTYVIVDVIKGHRSAGATREHVKLSSDERVFIRRSVDLDARAGLSLGKIFIGMDLPDTVDLRPLPEVVVERYPDLHDHLYFVAEGDVVIVGPHSREVAFVIED